MMMAVIIDVFKFVEHSKSLLDKAEKLIAKFSSVVARLPFLQILDFTLLQCDFDL